MINYIWIWFENPPQIPSFIHPKFILNFSCKMFDSMIGSNEFRINFVSFKKKFIRLFKNMKELSFSGLEGLDQEVPKAQVCCFPYSCHVLSFCFALVVFVFKF